MYHVNLTPVSDPENKELSFGEKAVGIRFNPSADNEVEEIKALYAAIIDKANQIKEKSVSPEQKRLASIAITEAQGAQMWAVKAATWRD